MAPDEVLFNPSRTNTYVHVYIYIYMYRYISLYIYGHIHIYTCVYNLFEQFRSAIMQSLQGILPSLCKHGPTILDIADSPRSHSGPI